MADTEYATLAELKTNIDYDAVTDDVALQSLLNAAARMIDQHCKREQEGFIADDAATARIYAGDGTAVQRIDECVEITLVAVKTSALADDFTSWAVTDWFEFAGDAVTPNLNPIVQLRPITGIMADPTGDEAVFTSGLLVGRAGFRPTNKQRRHSVATVQITAKWGYATDVPPDIKIATILVASGWFKRSETGWMDMVASAELGQMFITKALDPAAVNILDTGGYRKVSV